MIQLNNITKTYITSNNSTRDVLNNISLTVQKGDSVAIIGPSGSGKSTLLNIIGTLDIPSSGTLLINDLNYTTLNERELANFRNQKIGFVFQMHYLLPQLNVIENILLPVIPQKNKNNKKATERAMELLQTVGLVDRIHQLPSQLSVGECQRVAVVRALINEPELLLADEPTGALDQHTAYQMGLLLTDINKRLGVTTIVVTHSSELAGRMNTVYQLLDGKLVKK